MEFWDKNRNICVVMNRYSWSFQLRVDSEFFHLLSLHTVFFLLLSLQAVFFLILSLNSAHNTLEEKRKNKT